MTLEITWFERCRKNNGTKPLGDVFFVKLTWRIWRQCPSPPMAQGKSKMAGYGNQVLVKNAFLWFMSAIYLFAFSSLYIQIPGQHIFSCLSFVSLCWSWEVKSILSFCDNNAGLYGRNGVLPAKLTLRKGEKSSCSFCY